MTTAYGVERARQEGSLWGIPLGALGFFQTLLMSFATGFVAFFVTTFLAIVSMMIYLMATGKTPNFALTYKHYGLPVGVVAFAVALGYLGTLWVRRKVRG